MSLNASITLALLYMTNFGRLLNLTTKGIQGFLFFYRSTDDTVMFLNELPYRLRMELAYKIQHKIHANISFFQDKPKDFIAQLGYVLRPIRVRPGQYIYQENEPVVESKAYIVQSQRLSH